MKRPFYGLGRWTLLALFALGIAGTLQISGVSRASTPGSLPPTIHPLDDESDFLNDPDYGKPKKALAKAGAKDVITYESNQDGKKFKSYGSVIVPLCDLPEGFSKLDDNAQRRWCRKQLADKYGMTDKFTNHELVLYDSKKNPVSLAVYKVDELDHSGEGRALMYHIKKKPDGKAYYGGISQLKSVPAECFKKAAPMKKRLASGLEPEALTGPTCESCACSACIVPVANICGDDQSHCAVGGTGGTESCP